MSHATVYLGFKDGAGAHVYRLEDGKVASLDPLRIAFGNADIPFKWPGKREGLYQLAIVLAVDMIVDTLSAARLVYRLAGRLAIHIKSQAWCLRACDLRSWLALCWREHGFKPEDLHWIADHVEAKGGA